MAIGIPKIQINQVMSKPRLLAPYVAAQPGSHPETTPWPQRHTLTLALKDTTAPGLEEVVEELERFFKRVFPVALPGDKPLSVLGLLTWI